MTEPAPQARWFVELGDACDEAGMNLVVLSIPGRGPRIAVLDPDGATYSRDVGPTESYDRCAQIVLNGMRRSRVLPRQRPQA